MGKLIDGQWHDIWYDTASTGGSFLREDATFRHWITADGSAGPAGEPGFAAAPGRYHLYVSLACPWAHRTLLFRHLKQLESMISVSVVNPYMGEQGWGFTPAPGVVPDPVLGATHLYQIYQRAKTDFTGRVTVPVLWDRQRNTIVSNESADIIRMFNSAFDHLGAAAVDYYPPALRTDIDAINALVYSEINNGVYRAGFATTQQAYAEAVTALFTALDTLEQRLTTQRYLAGHSITEADWRLFTTLIRFDAVYFGHFKCNLHRIEDYPNLSGYLRDLYQVSGVAGTVNFDHIKTHYYVSHKTINPTGIVPLGPELDFSRAYRRNIPT